MLCKQIFLYIFLLVFIGKGYASGEVLNGTWGLYKISHENVLGEHDAAMVKSPGVLYGQVEIKVDQAVITVTNNLLQGGGRCSISYKTMKSTPAMYFHSNNTVDLYKNI